LSGSCEHWQALRKDWLADGDGRAGKRARSEADTEKGHERKTSSLKECVRAMHDARGE
jgi:hypothetical protein